MWRVLSILWDVAINIVTGIVILAMFNAVHGKFETIVVTGLVLIYVSISFRFGGAVAMMMAALNQHHERYINLANALNIDTELNREVLKEDEAKARKMMPEMVVSMIFNSIFYFIAIWHLFNAVV